MILFILITYLISFIIWFIFIKQGLIIHENISILNVLKEMPLMAYIPILNTVALIILIIICLIT